MDLQYIPKPDLIEILKSITFKANFNSKLFHASDDSSYIFDETGNFSLSLLTNNWKWKILKIKLPRIPKGRNRVQNRLRYVVCIRYVIPFAEFNAKSNTIAIIEYKVRFRELYHRRWRLRLLTDNCTIVLILKNVNK